MKLKYILPLIFIFSTIYSNAQVFNGGMMAGIVASQVAGDNYSGFHKAGLFAGAFVNLQIADHSALQMELEYFQKGSRENPTKKNNYAQYLFRTSYIEMPLLYQYIINNRIKVEAGPSIGFNTGYYEEIDSYEQKDGIQPAKLSYQINVGLYVALTKNLMVNIRTNNSILNIRSRNTDGDVHRFFDYGQYNDSLVLSVFYQIKAAE
jgi:hypothetical protein